MSKKVEILTDHDAEMLLIKVDGECVFEQNEWDFTTWQHLPHILKSLGAEVVVGEYSCED